MPLHFNGLIEIRGINPYVLVSAAQAEELRPGWRRPMPVLVQVDGRPEPAWRINMMPVGDGSFYLYLHASVRQAAGKDVGDRANFDVWFDEEYESGPAHPMPPWFAEALGANAVAKANWERLIPSRQKEILRYFAGLKSSAAQSANLRRAIDVLSGIPGRFMARAWKDGQ